MKKDSVLDGFELARRVGVSVALVGMALTLVVLALKVVGVPLSAVRAPFALFAGGAVLAAVAELSRRSVATMTFRSHQH